MSLNILWASNGKNAVDIFKQHSDLSLVLMDLRMPVLDGYKATDQILKYKSDTRIIAQTAYAMSGDKKKSIQTGFVDYITKPMQKEKLIETIGKWIE